MDRPADTIADNELRIERVFEASPDLLFRLWTDPVHVVRWYGPEGFDCLHFEADLQPGGRWRGCIRSDNQGELWMGGTYREIRPGRRIVFTFRWDHDEAVGDTLVTIDFLDEGDGRTRQIFHQAPFKTVEQRDSHVGGWTSALVCQDSYLQQLAGKDRS